MKQTKNRKKWAVAATTLAAMAALAGTFAWFTSQDSAKNHFEGNIAGNDVDVVEQFDPKPWEPGMDINKDVAAFNSGNYDSMIRISFDEVLTKLADPEAKSSTEGSILNGKTDKDLYLFPLDETIFTTGTWADSKVAEKSMTVTGGSYAGTYTLKAKEQATITDDGTTYRYVSYWDNGTNKYYAKVNTYKRAADGTITPSTDPSFKYVDLTLGTPAKADWTKPVYTPTMTIDATGKATVVADVDGNIELNFVNLSAKPTANKWFYNASDGYFYYVAVVKAGTQTAQLLDSVKLTDKADNTYSKMQFDLDVNAKSIQAVKEAVNSTDWVNNTNADLATALQGLYK